MRLHGACCSLLVVLNALAIASRALAGQAVTPNTPPTKETVMPTTAPGPDQKAATLSNEPDHSKEAFVIESQSSIIRFENDGTGRREIAIRVRIQSEAAVQTWGQLRLGYNAANEKLEISYVHVIKKNGSVINADPNAVQDLTPFVQQIAPMYTDYHEKHVTVPGLRPGDTLEAKSVSLMHTPLAPGQFWMQYEFNHLSIVLDERLELNVPASRSVKLKTKPGLNPTISDEAGRRVYRWTSSHLVREEDDDKKAKDKTKKRKMKVDEFPDVQLTTFSNWEEVGRWYAELEKDRRTPSKEIRSEASALTKGLNSNAEKAEALYDFVAKNFRYVALSFGAARYQPHAAADVLHNQYGDCKDKNTLLAALLEAEGIHSSSALINWGRKVDPDVPSPSQFNHVITVLPLGDDKIWMDTTTEVAPFRLLPPTLRKKQVLVIPPDGPARLEETPADPGVANNDLAQIDGKLSDAGKLEAKVSWTVRGDAELRLRLLFRHTPPAQWQKTVEGYNKSIGGEVTNIRVGDPSDTRAPFLVSYDVSKENFVDWQKKKVDLKLPLSVFRPPTISADVGEEEDANADPESAESVNFQIGPVCQRTYSLKLEFASRYAPAMPLPIALDRDYASYRSTYKFEHNVFAAERVFIVRKNELPPSRADDYRTFRNNLLADEAQTLTIESAAANTHDVPSNMGVGELIKSADEARNNGNYPLAIDLYNRAIGIEPKNKRGWDKLGLAYYDSHQDELASNAFRKQVEINPYDQSAYNNLGRVYWRQRKYDEAEKWFLKQIEVSPLDKYAHHNLGAMYVEWHKYEQAIPELERAASISPSNADPQVRLGEAYLNLSQDEKAVAAFDRAVQISATPSVWNSIAYQLSLKRAHLDRAESYAESALASTSAALRNISIDSIDRRQLGLSSALASYWDTLGWVAFAQGKIDRAEKYVSAAWQLSQTGEEGDHLAQIYQARDSKKEDVIHLCALSLTTRWPLSETRDRLAKLVGAEEVDAEVSRHKNELQQLRTVLVKNPGKKDGEADFFVLLSPGMEGVAKVDAIKFVRGSESLKDMADAMRSAKYPQNFPDANAVKILRRGTLSCTSTSADCSFVIDLPADVRSTD